MKDVEKIIKILQKEFNVNIKLGDPFRILIGVMLSHRTTDKTSWPATDRLFKRANSPRKIYNLSAKKIEKIIYPVGFYRNKSKNLRRVCKILLENYNGKVPRIREELMKLPGVGGKSADIILSYAYGEPVIAVDSHVNWVSNVLGWTDSKKPEKIREDLHKIIPKKHRLILNDLLVNFGRDICNTGRPKCYKCPIVKLCPYPKKNLKQPL